MKSLFERLRARRLTSIFILLGTLSIAVIGGSFVAHGVRGQEKQNDSADATPLKVTSSPVAPNEFVKIAKQVGPAVVNINTQTLPKQSTTRGPRPTNPHTRNPHQQQPPDGDSGSGGGGDGEDGQDGGQGGGQGNFQDFFNKFFGGQAPDQ